MLLSVAEAISSYLLTTNVQMASYALASRAESRVSHGACAAAALLGAESPDDVMLGQSATQLVFSLSMMLETRVLADRAAGAEGAWQEGDEIIISDADHETNRGAWTRLATRLGLKLKHWPVTRVSNSESKYAVTLDPKVLETLVTSHTRVVAFTACSNLLGAFTDIGSATQVVRKVAKDALVCVDCVAFAPHRRITPRSWDVDVAFFSLYKTYGAHVGAMYVDPRVKETQLARLNHFFLHTPHAPPGMYPFQTSSVQYELNYSIAAVADYLVSLGTAKQVPSKVDWNALFGRASSEGELTALSRSEVDDALDAAYARVAAHETTLLQVIMPVLLKWADKGLRIVGPEDASSDARAPTIAFVLVDAQGNHRVGTSKAIHQALVRSAIGAQQGHMYAHKLVSSLGLDLADGVIRLSFVHYNSADEVRRTADLLTAIFQTLV